ncbi:MAG: NosD domain-containing protein [Planctomycetota bacterium]|jgi:parallel beta-helix repeat protein
MRRRQITTLTLALVFIMVGVHSATATHYIPTDTTIGTWDAATQTYTLTTDPSDGIEIKIDGLTLDGAGHTVSGTGSGFGIYLEQRTGVTVKDLVVKRFKHGIRLGESNNNTLDNNTCSDNSSAGIHLVDSTPATTP